MTRLQRGRQVPMWRTTAGREGETRRSGKRARRAGRSVHRFGPAAARDAIRRSGGAFQKEARGGKGKSTKLDQTGRRIGRRSRGAAAVHGRRSIRRVGQRLAGGASAGSTAAGPRGVEQR